MVYVVQVTVILDQGRILSICLRQHQACLQDVYRIHSSTLKDIGKSFVVVTARCIPFPGQFVGLVLQQERSQPRVNQSSFGQPADESGSKDGCLAHLSEEGDHPVLELFETVFVCSNVDIQKQVEKQIGITAITRYWAEEACKLVVIENM